MYDTKLLLFATLTACWCAVYQKLTFAVLCLDAYEHFDHFVKIANNVRSYKPRSLPRNLLFNTWRCMGNEVFASYVLQRPMEA